MSFVSDCVCNVTIIGAVKSQPPFLGCLFITVYKKDHVV